MHAASADRYGSHSVHEPAYRPQFAYAHILEVHDEPAKAYARFVFTRFAHDLQEKRTRKLEKSMRNHSLAPNGALQGAGGGGNGGVVGGVGQSDLL